MAHASRIAAGVAPTFTEPGDYQTAREIAFAAAKITDLLYAEKDSRNTEDNPVPEIPDAPKEKD